MLRSFPRKRESSVVPKYWVPASAGTSGRRDQLPRSRSFLTAPRPLVAIERPARARGDIERVGEPAHQPLAAGPRDHRTVIGAQFGRRRDQHGALLDRNAIERAADRLIDRDTARDDQ